MWRINVRFEQDTRHVWPLLFDTRLPYGAKGFDAEMGLYTVVSKRPKQVVIDGINAKNFAEQIAEPDQNSGRENLSLL